MPPRYAYWTILVDDQPTAFRASAQEDLLPTFNRLKEKHPGAVMKWFQNGKLWDSRVDAQEAMHARGERGRSADPRQSGFRARKREWQPRGDFQKPEAEGRGPRQGQKFAAEGRESRRSAERGGGREGGPPGPAEKLEWKPKGEFTPAPRRSESPDWKPKGSFDRESKPAWKPKGSFDRGPKPEWKPKASFDRDRKPEWKPKGSVDRDRKPEWKPKGTFQKSDAEGRGPRRSAQREGGPQAAGRKPPASAKREGAWIPKAEYKKSKGIEARRDKNWRPGGEHKDPRQKYKDAKKAKWSRFKTAVRSRWESKAKKKS